MKRTTRRSFLMSSALGAAAVAGMGKALAAPSKLDANPATPKPTYRMMREIPVDEGYDLVVAGGGPAGVAAAVCAARLGVKVLLLEATGCLGGMGTNAYVSNWYSMGDGQQLFVGGFIVEVMHALCREGFATPSAIENFNKKKYLGAVGFNPEGLKLIFDKLCVAAGVEVRFYTRVIDADADPKEKRLHGVITNSVEGYHYIRAKAFIDATGDAILTGLCGAPARAAGKDTPNIMPPTLCARICDIDFDRFGKASQQGMIEKAIADKYFSQPDRHVPGIMRAGVDHATMNAGHLFHTDALKTASLSEGMMHGRRLVQEYAAFYRKYMPGCEKMQVMATGNLLGVRESRRIVGEYELNYEDFKARRHFPDQIALYCKAIDIHVYDLGAAEYERYHSSYTKVDKLGKGESYGIPYGVLVPRGWSNLWVAGRCVSADVKVNGAIRDQPGCSMMGQAAGTAAVQSIRTGQAANQLDTAQLVQTLRQAGANLPQETLSKEMTRAGRA